MMDKNALDSLDSKDVFQVKIIDKESELTLINFLLKLLGDKNRKDTNTLPSHTSKLNIFPYYLIYNKTNIWWSKEKFLDFPLIDIYESNKNGFNSQQEILGYLIEGGKVCRVTNIASYYSLKGGKICKTFPDGVCIGWTSNFMNYRDYIKYIEPPKWYENIPKQGILCRVSDNEKDYKLEIVLKYDEVDPDYKFETIDSCFKFATPLTKEEVLKYIYKEK